MTYLIFETYQDAYVANAVITLNMRLGGGVSVQWAEPQQRQDGKWILQKPEQRFMNFVSTIGQYAGVTEEEYNDNWFAPSTEI